MKDKTYKSYMWTNSVSRKSYIGYTGDGVAFRWSKHILKANGIHIETIAYKFTTAHNNNISRVGKGKIWVTDKISGLATKIHPDLFDSTIMIKGRKNVNN